MPGVPAVREPLGALWQALGVGPVLQRALYCGSLAQVARASPCFFAHFFGVGLVLASGLKVWKWVFFFVVERVD